MIVVNEAFQLSKLSFKARSRGRPPLNTRAYHSMTPFMTSSFLKAFHWQTQALTKGDNISGKSKTKPPLENRSKGPQPLPLLFIETPHFAPSMEQRD